MTSSRPDRRYRDYSKIYSFWPGDTPRLEDLPHFVALAAVDGMQPGIPMSHTEWCRDNCTRPWAWWFDENHAYIGFSNENECVLYLLSNQ